MPDLSFWELSGSARARLKRQAPQWKSATFSSRPSAMATDRQVALAALPLQLQHDIQLTLAAATALGGAPGHPRQVHAAAVLVAAHRAREAGSRG